MARSLRGASRSIETLKGNVPFGTACSRSMRRPTPIRGGRLERTSTLVGAKVWEQAEHILRMLGKVDLFRIDGRLHNGEFVVIELTPDIHLGTDSPFLGGFDAMGKGPVRILDQLIRSLARKSDCRYMNASGPPSASALSASVSEITVSTTPYMSNPTPPREAGSINEHYRKLAFELDDGDKGNFLSGWQCENPFATPLLKAVRGRCDAVDYCRYTYFDADERLAEAVLAFHERVDGVRPQAALNGAGAAS